MFYVYVIKNEKGETYIGFTSDLEKRLESHNSGNNKSTRGNIWEYVYYEAFKSESDARMREQKLKQRGQSVRHLKERIINSLE